MASSDKEQMIMKQEASSLMITCAKLANDNDKLERRIENLEYRIEQLRAALGSIEDVGPDEVDLAPWWAGQAIEEDNKFTKDDPDEQ
jgi:hypothetical protein